MIYLLFLPVVVIVAAMLACVNQALVSEFIDLARVERVVWMAVVAWSLGGWLLEARAAERVVALFEACEAEATEELRDLEEFVFGLVGAF